MKLPRLFISAFVILSLTACSSIPKKVSSLASSASKSEVFFGGSFDPPTKSHLRLMARFMHNEGFRDGTLMVAIPYKKEAERDGINLELTRLAMKDMPEILKLEEIPYSEFTVTEEGCAEWVEVTTDIYTLCPGDLEYKEKIFEDTSRTLKKINEVYAVGEKNIFWLAGTDVLNSITTWPNWRDLFNLTHWVLLPRGDVTATTFDLSSKLPSDFLAQYTRSTDGRSVHYKNKDDSKPDIFILGQDTIPGSSSEARAIIREKKGVGLEQLLTSSVIKRIYEKGYYKKLKSN